MRQYLDLLQEVRSQPTVRPDRTGTGTLSVFGRSLCCENVWMNFPILTTKRVHFKSVAAELAWFISGSTNAKDLNALGSTIWDEWASPDGDLGPIYGKQWRNWGGIDQLKAAVELFKKDPYSRRNVVSAWNVEDLPKMALNPCHVLWQLYGSKEVIDGVHLPCVSLSMYQRSADIFLGVPFNIASYALLLSLIAKEVGVIPKDLYISFGDLHLYSNHFEQADLQLSREPRNLPQLQLSGNSGLFDFHPSHAKLSGYRPEGAIKAPVSV